MWPNRRHWCADVYAKGRLKAFQTASGVGRILESDTCSQNKVFRRREMSDTSSRPTTASICSVGFALKISADLWTERTLQGCNFYISDGLKPFSQQRVGRILESDTCSQNKVSELRKMSDTSIRPTTASICSVGFALKISADLWTERTLQGCNFYISDGLKPFLQQRVGRILESDTCSQNKAFRAAVNVGFENPTYNCGSQP